MQSHRLHHIHGSRNSLQQAWRRALLAWRGWSIPAMILGGGVVLLAFGAWSIWLPENTIARGVTIAGSDFSGLTPAQATLHLQQAPALPDRAFQIRFEDQSWQKSSSQLGESLDINQTLQQAFAVGRTGSWLEQIRDRWISLWDTTEVAMDWQFDQFAVQDWVNEVDRAISVAGELPSVQLTPRLIVNAGERGLRLQSTQLVAQIQAVAGEKNPDSATVVVSAPVEVTVTPLSADGITAAEARAQKLARVTLRVEASEIDLPQDISAGQFFPWLEWPTGFNEATLSAGVRDRTQSWNREPISAEFELSPDQKKLVKFSPHRDGQTVDYDHLIPEIQRALIEAETAPTDSPQPIVIQATLQTTPPQNTLGDLNTLGIRERIALGTSTYAGSIPNRVFNVQHTAKLVHGTIIAPGEEFSFNQVVGDISAATGFKAAYVIKDGRTQLGDGGGVCQVSTTIFRAVLDGGLPITRWKAHSYRVGYYEQGSQPGFDATVYAPSVDFRFRNDTGHSIAVAAYADSDARSLRVELWGTNDGRTAEVTNYKIWNQRSAPAPLFVDDPGLPAGRRQQIDWSAPEANASFHYVAKKANGEVIQDREFVSVFRPWQAVFLVGTGGQ